jgi:hypothetical protein
VRVFYRLLSENPPSDKDLLSYHDYPKDPPLAKRDDPEFLHRWKGLSVYDTYQAARDLAAARKWKRWKYIGVLHIPEDAPIICEGPEEHGHWNLYGTDPASLRERYLVRIVHAETTVNVPPDD